eukprot:4794699-Amphidinium_carterae.1
MAYSILSFRPWLYCMVSLYAIASAWGWVSPQAPKIVVEPTNPVKASPSQQQECTKGETQRQQHGGVSSRPWTWPLLN